MTSADAPSPNNQCCEVAEFGRRRILQGLLAAGALPYCTISAARASNISLENVIAADGSSTRVLHGVTIIDPFGWLDEAKLDDPQVTRLIASSDVASNRLMAPLETLVKQLRSEALAASPPRPEPAPVRDGEFGYWTDWSQGRRQLWRVQLASGAQQLLLDASEISVSDKPIGDFVAWGLSPNGETLAFATMSTPEHHDVRFKQVASGQFLDDVVREVGVQITSEQIVWTGDGRGIIYSEVNDADRSWRARIHWLGQQQAEGPVLHEEAESGFYVEIRQTTSGRYALINASSIDTKDVRLIDRHDLGSIKLVSARVAGRFYTVDHGAGPLEILTNDMHPNFRLVKASIKNPDKWIEVLPGQDRTSLNWHKAFRRHLVVSERHEGISRVRVFDREKSNWRSISFPERVAIAGFDRWTAGPEANREPDPAQLRLGVETFAQPKALYDYRFADGDLVALQDGRTSPGNYVTERLEAVSPDGTVVPMSMIRPRHGQLRGALLYGYGAYGIPADPDFDPQRFSLLDRGVAYVIAHVRGGGDLGGAWHNAGRGTQRGKPIDDFIACANALVAQGFVESGKIVSMGRSAGGWLVGTALNRNPDLWAGMIADVPFVDVMTSLLDRERALTAIEISEVGDVVADPAAFARVLRLCAYQNVPSLKLPPMYLTASLADVRIPWSGVLKYVARVRAASPSNEVVLRLDRDGNHWGPADPETGSAWRAERVAFTLRALGIV